MTKKWYQSKIVWVGILTTLSAVLLSLADLVSKGALTAADVILFAAGVIQIILRIWFTEEKTA